MLTRDQPIAIELRLQKIDRRREKLFDLRISEAIEAINENGPVDSLCTRNCSKRRYPFQCDLEIQRRFSVLPPAPRSPRQNRLEEEEDGSVD